MLREIIMPFFVVTTPAIALIITSGRALSGDHEADRSIAALRIVWDGGEVLGTSVLVRREDRMTIGGLVTAGADVWLNTHNRRWKPRERAA